MNWIQNKFCFRNVLTQLRRVKVDGVHEKSSSKVGLKIFFLRKKSSELECETLFDFWKIEIKVCFDEFEVANCKRCWFLFQRLHFRLIVNFLFWFSMPFYIVQMIYRLSMDEGVNRMKDHCGYFLVMSDVCFLSPSQHQSCKKYLLNLIMNKIYKF